MTYTHGLYDATKLVLDAIEKKDADQMLDLGDQLDQACEKCHMHYWYPHQFDPHPEGLPPGEGASRNMSFPTAPRAGKMRRQTSKHQPPRAGRSNLRTNLNHLECHEHSYGATLMIEVLR